jgi:hypothetical protein
MKAVTKASRGNKYVHLVCSANGLYFVHPMPVKSDASTALEKFFRKFGIMTDLHTDNAPELTAGDYRKTANDHMVNCTTTEPHSPWQNLAEPGINMVKKHTRWAINQERILGAAWDYVLSWSAEVLSHLAFATNGNRLGIQNIFGDSPDISHLLYFDIYQPVHYLEQGVAFPDDCQLLGLWLGPSHDVGQALCYWIMKPNGEVISRSTVKAITKSDITLDVRLAADIAAMDKQIAGKFGLFTKVVLEEDEQDEGHYHDRDENDRESDREVDPLAQDLLVGAQVNLSSHLPEIDGEHATVKVIGCKRTADGELVGKYHPDRNLDTRQYEVEYQDGTREAHLMNSITAALHSELDNDGKRWYTFDSIVDHKRDEGGKGRTKGWLLEIMWKDGTATWETLTAMK